MKSTYTQALRVLAGIVEAPRKLAVVYVERAFLSAHVRAVIDALIEWAPACIASVRRASQQASFSARREN